MTDKKNNTGVDNSGNYNSGDYNSGNSNYGNRNSGNSNYGNRNSGNYNYGNRNSGDSNYGNRNSGNRNSGNSNSGYRNSGYYNYGNYNSGDSNYGDFNSGDFNTDEPKMRLFNKECQYTRTEMHLKNLMPDFSDMNPCVWIEENIMTEEEKTKNPTYKTTGGYLKTIEYKEAWAVWKRKCTKENWEKVLALPNFDPAIFEEITGIKVEDNSEAKKRATELREKADELLAQAKALEESL